MNSEEYLFERKWKQPQPDAYPYHRVVNVCPFEEVRVTVPASLCTIQRSELFWYCGLCGLEHNNDVNPAAIQTLLSVGVLVYEDYWRPSEIMEFLQDLDDEASELVELLDREMGI